MVPFLAESLETQLRLFCTKLIRKDVLESAKTASLLIKLDVADKANQKDINSVDLGFGIKYALKRLIDSKKVTSLQVFQFKKRSNGVFGKSLQSCNRKKSTSIFVCKVPEMFVSKLHGGILKILRADV